MSKTFLAQSRNGNLSMGSEYNADRFRQFLKDNPWIRIKIEPLFPESHKQRGFFEGAVIPLIAFYQEGMNHQEPEDLRKVRDWLKIEFTGELVVIKGRVNKVAKSTKGELNKGFLERVIDWMGEQGYQTELLDPEEFKKWRDEIFGFEEGPDNYISYLVEIGKLRLPVEKQ